MAENAKPNTQDEKLNGLFVRGVVMSSTAKAYNRKDGSGKSFVIAGMNWPCNLGWRCARNSTTPKTAR